MFRNCIRKIYTNHLYNRKRLLQHLMYFQNILKNYTFYLPLCVFSFRYDPAILPPQKLPMPLRDMLLDPPVEFMNSSIYLCDMWLLSCNKIKKKVKIKLQAI